MIRADADTVIAVRSRRVGQISVAATQASSAPTAALLGVAGSGVSDRIIQVLRQFSFYTGGFAHVVNLRLFVFASSVILDQMGLLGKVSR